MSSMKPSIDNIIGIVSMRIRHYAYARTSNFVSAAPLLKLNRSLSTSAEDVERGAESAERSYSGNIWPPRRFDPDTLSAGAHKHRFKLFKRSVIVATEMLLLRIGAMLHLGGMQGRAERLRNSLIRLGPAFTKFGQAMATRPDFLPKEYCEELSKLQDKVPTFPTSVARATISEELNSPIVDIFEEFSTEPVAAASLAQVYRARLRGSGEIVAVKIQRPNLHETIALDSLILRSLAGTLGNLFNVRSDLAGVMDELVGRIFEEIDFVREAESMQSFYSMYDTREKMKLAANDGMVAIAVPRVFKSLCTRRVLVMEWMSGVKLTDLEALRVLGVDTRLLLDVGVRCSLRQLLCEGHFHADPHPGNLMATDEGLAYLDFGMMCRISSSDRYGLLRLLVSFVNRDAGIMSIELRQLGFLPFNTKLTEIEHSIEEAFKNGDQDVENKDFQGAVEQFSTVLRDYDFRVPPRYALIIRALGSLEGSAVLLQPEFKVVAAAYPIVLEFLIEDKSPEMRRILQSMLLNTDGQVRWARLQRLLEAALKNSDNNDDTDEKTFSNFFVPMGPKKPASEIDLKLADGIYDALQFLESKRSLKVRKKLIEDILNGLNLNKLESTENSVYNHHKSSNLEIREILGKMNGPLQWVGGRIQTSPDVWLPVIARISSSRAVHEICFSVVRGLLRRFGRSAAEDFLIILSSLLRATRL